MDFPERLKAIRKEKGLTQSQVAERMGITYQNYAQYERGKRTPKLETKRRIAAALGIGLFELETWGEESPGSSVVMWDKNGAVSTIAFPEGTELPPEGKELDKLFIEELKKAPEYKEAIDSLYDETINKKDYDEELKNITDRLNEEGKKKVWTYAFDLSDNPKYRKNRITPFNP